MNKSTPSTQDLQHPIYIEQNTASLTDIMLVLARHLKYIIFMPLITCSVAIIYVLFLVEPVYTSTSKIMSSSSNSFSQAVGLAAQFGINIPTSQKEPKWVYPDILKSRTLAKAVLQQKFSTNWLGEQKTLLQILTYEQKQLELNMDTLEKMAVSKLIGMIRVYEEVKTGILTLNVDSQEPKLAAEINQTLIDELDSHQRRYNKAKTSDTKQFILERIQDTEKELIDAEESLKVFRDRNRRIENSPALQLEQQRLGREVTVLTGVYTTLKQQLETSKIEEVKESDYVVVLDPPEVPIIQSKPNKKFIVIFAGFFGLGLGVFFAFIRDYIFNSSQGDRKKIKELKTLVRKNIKSLFYIK
tara:strand:+ start:1148 stop:2218 length:1071 start_codon:yes stop_codon:yes gene_type:complete